MQKKTLQVLEISSSGRRDGSVTRQLSNDLVAALEDRFGTIETTRRDLSSGVPFVDEAWIEANFTPDAVRTRQHVEALAYSDELVVELKKADIVVIGVPIYNFSIPATLKAWIDMIARARLTFQYTDSGPVGLLEGKKAYLVVATGGVPVGSAIDFATPYLRHALAFVGINDVEVIAADQLNNDAGESMDRARAQIAAVIHLSAQAA
ncbi:MAG: NAD(P)H-dependent oxidoreductase [Proteobacteria bacterium]|nr:NAD(P)H-dependent oxidoreductase [Pseudomonadota bacterium]